MVTMLTLSIHSQNFSMLQAFKNKLDLFADNLSLELDKLDGYEDFQVPERISRNESRSTVILIPSEEPRVQLTGIDCALAFFMCLVTGVCFEVHTQPQNRLPLPRNVSDELKHQEKVEQERLERLQGLEAAQNTSVRSKSSTPKSEVDEAEQEILNMVSSGQFYRTESSETFDSVTSPVNDWVVINHDFLKK